MGDEHRVAGDLAAADTTRLGLFDHGLHHGADVLDVETGAVERRIGGDRSEHFADRLQPALASGLGRLDHEGRCAHAEDHPVAPTVERRRGVFDVFVGRCGATGEEAAGEPGHQRVSSGVVGGHDDYAAATPGANPVLGERHRLRRRGARGVDLGVRTAGPDDLGELRVTHREHAEQEPAIEAVRVRLHLGAEVGDQAIDLGRGRLGALHAGPHPFEGEQVLTACAVGHVGLDVLGEAVVAGEGAREDHAGVVAERVGQSPTIGQLGSEGGGLVAHHQRDAGIAEGVESGTDRQPGRVVERLVAGGVDRELLDDVERSVTSGELDHLGGVVDRLEARSARLALDQPGDVHVGHACPRCIGERVDELLSVEDSGDVSVVEGVLDPREAECGPGDDHRFGVDPPTGCVRCGRWRRLARRLRRRPVDPEPFFDHSGEQLTELHDAIVRRAPCGGGGHGSRRRRHGGG